MTCGWRSERWGIECRVRARRLRWVASAWIRCGIACGVLTVAGCQEPGGAVQGPEVSAERAADGLRIAFGSCLDQNRPAPVLAALLASRPDVLVLLGDNVYADTEDDAALRSTYAQQLARPEFARLLTETPRWFATWDDHDYGANDAGAEFPAKLKSQHAFLDFLQVAAESPRRQRAGVYHAEVVGDEPRRVQFILLDTRFHRSSLALAEQRESGHGPYRPSDSAAATMLGAAQWAWLVEQLRVPAEVRIIASSVQFVSDRHGWECWGNLPRERDRFLGAIREAGACGVIVISGDRHHGEVSRLDANESGLGYPLYDVTSSSLNRGRGRVEEFNPHRLGDPYGEPNYGAIEISWLPAGARVTLELRAEEGRVVERHELRLQELSPRE
ncbi:MAG: alkaline phosphatase D family protein [Planctomycetota bacterium]